MFFFRPVIGRQFKVSFSLLTFPDANSKQTLHRSNAKFLNVIKVMYLRKNEYPKAQTSVRGVGCA